MAKNKKAAADAPYAIKPDNKWEIEDALRTLNRADEIRKNKKLMSDVAKLAREQIDSLKKHVAASDNALIVGDSKKK